MIFYTLFYDKMEQNPIFYVKCLLKYSGEIAEKTGLL